MKKRIIHIVCSIVVGWGTCLHAAEPDFSFWTDPKAREVIQTVVAEMHHVPLLDGKSVFGDEISGSYFCKGGLDNEWRMAAHQSTQFRKRFKNPIKSTGWVRNTYYTPEEILEIYQDLADRACRLNPDAVSFFRRLLAAGQIFTTPLPGLERQDDRAKLFQRIDELRTNGGQEAVTGLTEIGEELAAQAARRAPAADLRDDDAASGGGATLRHRRPTPPTDDETIMLHEASGDETDHSTESDPLLPKED